MCVGVVDQYTSIARNAAGAKNTSAKRTSAPARELRTDGAAIPKKNPGRAAKKLSSLVGAGTPKKWVPLAPSYMREKMDTKFDPFRLDQERAYLPKHNLCNNSTITRPPHETYNVAALFSTGDREKCLLGNDGLQHTEAHGKGTWTMKVNLRCTTTKELLVFLGRRGKEDTYPDGVIECRVLYDGEWGVAKRTSSIMSIAEPFPKDRLDLGNAPGVGVVIKRIPNGYGRFSVRERHGDTDHNEKGGYDESMHVERDDQLFHTGEDGACYRWKVLAEGIWNQGVLVDPDETVGIMSGFPHYGKYADFRTLVIAWALLRLWRIRIGPEYCEVQRWRGTVGDDGILLCDGDSVDGGEAGVCGHVGI